MMERAVEIPLVTQQAPVRFEEFFEAERDRLFRTMLLATHSVFDAEELVQEAFLRVWERWGRVGTMDNPPAYLHRVAFNAFLSRRRRVGSALRKGLLGQPAQRDEIAEVDSRHAVIDALRLLTPRERAAVVVIDVLGHPSDEAGRLLGIRAATARKLASRGRARLRERMDEIDG